MAIDTLQTRTEKAGVIKKLKEILSILHYIQEDAACFLEDKSLSSVAKRCSKALGAELYRITNH